MTQIFTATACLNHRAPAGYPECPERLAGILEGARADGADVTTVDLHALAEAAVAAIHDGDYVERFRRAVERGDGLLDSADNPLSPATWNAALGAVSATLTAADSVMAGRGDGALAAVRPPGHHAEHAMAMGFCFFNNAAVAAQHLLDEHDLQRVAIFDFDIHHGNGTQHIFEGRSDVMYLSTHQHPFYPGTGLAHETGDGEGAGATVNVPLPAGTGDSEWLSAIDEEILPALRRFEPEVVIASAGFDAWAGDPLGGFRVTADGFRDIGQRLGRVAAEVSQGRLLSVLEGGYDLRSLWELVSAYLAGVSKASA